MDGSFSVEFLNRNPKPVIVLNRRASLTLMLEGFQNLHNGGTPTKYPIWKSSAAARMTVNPPLEKF